jgi:hypothetical protein
MARPRQRKHKCLCCKSWFAPDPRKRGRQEYCSDTQCQRASKAASQQRWLRKSENDCYFHGPEHVARVNRWRRAHPRYWQKMDVREGHALQDVIDTQLMEAKGKSAHVNRALQDLMAKSPRWRIQPVLGQVDQSALNVGARRGDQRSPAGSR